MQAPPRTATAGDLAVTASALQDSMDASTNAVMKHLVFSTGQQAALQQQLSVYTALNSSAAAKARAARKQARVLETLAAKHQALLKWVAEIKPQVSSSHSVYGCVTGYVLRLHARFPALIWAPPIQRAIKTR